MNFVDRLLLISAYPPVTSLSHLIKFVSVKLSPLGYAKSWRIKELTPIAGSSLHVIPRICLLDKASYESVQTNLILSSNPGFIFSINFIKSCDIVEALGVLKSA